MAGPKDPHGGQPIVRRGPAAQAARLAVIIVHGRGDTADGILALAEEVGATDISFLAPQAAGNSWYPYSFLAPIADNEPGLTSALERLRQLVGTLEAEGVAGDRIALMGFSQGACLSLEFAARHARRYAAVIGLSGGLIGPPGTPRDYTGSLAGTAVFLGCSDIDPHIPLERVRETTEVMRRMGASVDQRIYPRMGHTVNADELAAVRALLGGSAGSKPRP